ncbi:MAG: ROK family protein [Erysipelotrichia bacterium]|nr:ROK family protein [Erysipelotrichia bacterium]NCC54510.1 ROK family protein [Erysipelotrichia bacterium]
MKYAVGIDIGGTNTRVALVNEKIQIVERIQFSTDVDEPKTTIAKIAQCITNFNEDICGIGLSCPGPLDLLNGKILETTNLNEKWHHFAINEAIKQACGYPVYLENDANLAALAEAVIGAGKDYEYVQFLTVSTGLGSGQVINKQIYIGAHGFAHEVANVCLWKDGPTHGSIYPGGVEAICSGTAIMNRAIKAGLQVEHAGEVNDLAKQGNEVAQQIMDDAKEYLANMCATLIAIIDPEIIILGGSVALKIDHFVEEVEQLTKTKVFDIVKPYVNIKKAKLDEDSGLLGAGYLAFSKM